MSVSDLHLQIGDLVKIRIYDGENAERVWAKIKHIDIEEQEIDIELMNFPISRGFSFRDRFWVPIRFVLEKWEDSQ